MARSPQREEVVESKIEVTYGDLHRYLYARTTAQPIRIKDLKRKFLEYQQANVKRREKTSPSIESNLGILSLKSPLESTSVPKLSRALESFPEEVQLCSSSLPGVIYGVCAKTHIPVGTWIGPYEGRKVKTGRTWLGKDSSFMWEVFHRGQLAFYLDGRDEELSSWMRFISCARNKAEQNLYAFQYCGNIYYRAFKEIPAGTELLVWYDEIYPQFMGIPLELKDLGNMETEEINANIPPEPRSNSTAFSDISLRTIQCSSINTSLNTNIHTYPTSTFSKRESVISIDDDETLSRDNDGNVVSPLKRLRQSSLGVEINSESTSKRKQTSIQKPAKSTEKETNMVPSENELGEDPCLGVFRCGQCDKVFAQKSVLQMHVCTRTPNKPFQCGFCGIAFANPNELRVHASAHCNEKPFKCGYCSRSFSGATTLNNHIRTHTGEKPFICEKCGKTYCQGSQLSKHLRLSSCYKHVEDKTSNIL